VTQTETQTTLHTGQDVRHRLTTNNGNTTSESTTPHIPATPTTDIQIKFQRALWRTLNYLLLFLFASIILIFESDWAFKVDKYFDGWPQPLPVIIHVYYIMEMSHYIYATIVIPFEPKQSDDLQMFTHHFITLVLLTGSYCYLYWRVGVTLLWLTDMSDPVLNIAKLFKYANKQETADNLFTLFAIVFIVSRIFVFPFLIGIPAFWGSWDQPHGHLLNYFLWGLVVIFYYWAFKICRIAYSRLVLGITDTKDED